jgi:hypothetical protein
MVDFVTIFGQKYVPKSFGVWVFFYPRLAPGATHMAHLRRAVLRVFL